MHIENEKLIDLQVVQRACVTWRAGKFVTSCESIFIVFGYLFILPRFGNQSVLPAGQKRVGLRRNYIVPSVENCRYTRDKKKYFYFHILCKVFTRKTLIIKVNLNVLSLSRS